jgi:hypothetical protein
MGGFDLRLYAPNELRALIEAAGMTMIASYGGLDHSPVQTLSRRLAPVARKNG